MNPTRDELLNKISKEWLFQVFQHALDSMGLLDNDGYYLVCNPAMLKSLSYTLEEITSVSMYKLAPQDTHEYLRAIWPEFTAKQNQSIGECDLITKDGKRLNALYRCVSHIWPDVHLVVYHDITEKKKFEQQMKEYQDVLASSLQKNTISEVVSCIAHEVNQPLTAIASYADTCIAKVDQTNPNNQTLLDILNRIIAQAQRAGEVTQRIKNFTRLSLPNRSQINIKKTVENVLFYLENVLTNHPVEVAVNLNDNLEFFVDRVVLEQVLHNIIRNALNALNKVEKPMLKLSASINNNGYLRIIIQDNGHGIAKEHLDKIFTPFFTLREYGTGVGLSLCKSIIEANGGNITASSHEVSKGATFTITLPKIAPIENAVYKDKVAGFCHH